MPALDYERIAALYDTYCVYDGDLEFLQAAASGSETRPVPAISSSTGPPAFRASAERYSRSPVKTQ